MSNNINNPDKPLVLLCKIDFSIPESIFLSLLETIRNSKQEKIKKFRFREDALRCLYGELLLKYSLENIYGIEYKEEHIAENEYGKPHLKNGGVHFNISHSGDWAAVVCSVSPVGIDIEKIVNPPYEIIPKNFTIAERKQIENIVEPVKAEKFFAIWTLKESYIKMLGKGLSKNLYSFSIIIESEKISVIDNDRTTPSVNFKLLPADKNHIAAVCLNNYNDEIYPRVITSEELYKPRLFIRKIYL